MRVLSQAPDAAACAAKCEQQAECALYTYVDPRAPSARCNATEVRKPYPTTVFTGLSR